MRVALSSVAELQMIQAATDYENKSKKLGLRFLSTIEDALLDVSQQPEAFRRLRGQVRRVMLDGFPWGLLYCRTVDEIRILALIHLHSDPASWETYFD